MVLGIANSFLQILSATSSEKSSPTAMPFLLTHMNIRTVQFSLPYESWLVNSNTRLDLKEVQLINNISLFFSWQYCGYTYIFGNFSVTSCTEVSEPSSIIAKLRSEKKPVNNYKSIMIMINNVTSSFRNNGLGQMLQSIACSKIDELYLCVFQFVCL